VTSREIVWKAIRFEGPPRIPLKLPEPWANDFTFVGPGPDPDWTPSVVGQDEWGCVWETTAVRNMGQVRGHPLDDWSKLADYRYPALDKPVRFEEPLAGIDRDEGKFVIAVIGRGLVHQLDFMRGTENYLCDHYTDPDRLGELADRVIELMLGAIRIWGASGKVDGLYMLDDWGLQDRSLHDPKVWRAFYKPRYARLIDEAHKHGLAYFTHSCGKIDDHLEDCIDIGLDVIQQDQQQNMGLESLSERFGGRLNFLCPVDIQNAMQGTPEEVVAYARKMVNLLGDFGGGFMADYYSSPEGAGHNQPNIDAMCQAFTDYGIYPLQ